MADQALTALEVDQLGLDGVDRRMLRSIIQHYAGGPVGLDTLAATVGEEAVTLEDVYEPYLMQIGFLTRTPRGGVTLALCAPGAALSGPGPGPAPPVTGDRVPAPGKCTKANGERQDFPRF